MKDHVKPSLRSTPNHFILHVGTNDLNSDQTSAVIDLATSLKNNQHDVTLVFLILPSEQIIQNQMRNSAKLIKFYPNYVMKELFISLIIQRR